MRIRLLDDKSCMLFCLLSFIFMFEPLMSGFNIILALNSLVLNLICGCGIVNCLIMCLNQKSEENFKKLG